ncbi:MAG TPA: CBS domain-containing protein [Thermodesulfobacteriota bacterium]|nr:CBS domain-containing protein [Deltaproteobacteria bacterium]HNR12288.1 CBS domain-containing protein [Thermodesulfobacteriota bacterium]HNU72507.1 CBS domain-containing protein [Thermodesulfobacteriota bacterium]HOC39300.1 CBS domain-containing protein [Thermodesulfobacteriota bacterium]
MNVREMMEQDFDFIDAQDTLKQAMQKMERLEAEVMPVFQHHKPLGIITKQDIILYASMKESDPETVTVKQIMRQP